MFITKVYKIYLQLARPPITSTSSPRVASLESFLGKGHPGTERRPPGGPACARARTRRREAGRACGQMVMAFG